MNTITPISILPEELLLEMFIYCWLRNFTDLRLRPEVTLSHVDRHWRKTTIAAPKLWTRIILFNLKKDLEPISVYLARSNQMPIDLVVFLPTSTNSIDLSEFCQLIEVHLPLLRNLRIHSNNLAEQPLLNLLKPLALPFLNSVRFSLTPQEAWPAGGPTAIFEGGAPMLSHICLRRYLPSTFQIPIQSATHLCLELSLSEWRRPESFTWITAQLASGAPLVFLDLGWIPVISSDIRTFDIPTLRTLVFGAKDWITTLKFLRAIIAPSLHHLILSLPYDSESHDFPESGPIKLQSLQRLTLRNMVHPCFPHFFQAFPLVTEVYVTDNISFLFFLLCLLGSAEGVNPLGMAWPNLRVIGTTDEPSFDELKSLLDQRAAKDAPIEKLLLQSKYMAQAREVVHGLEFPVLVEEFVYRSPFRL
ncbi:hypothetical protein HWV62_42277 [Athelia sp. TMB]|nr:hypothetical protein HWV62_42277 [Athelia sp. TMB]